MPVYVIAFESTHAAMAAEASFGSVPHAMIPIPRQITASCGMALRFEAEDDAAARGLFARQDAPAGLAKLFREESGPSGRSKDATYAALPL